MEGRGKMKGRREKGRKGGRKKQKRKKMKTNKTNRFYQVSQPQSTHRYGYVGPPGESHAI